MGDLYEFNQFSAVDSMHWRVRKIKEIDKRHLVVSHAGASGVAAESWERNALQVLDDDWLLAKPLDRWGVSCYQKDYQRISFTFNSIRSSSQGKPWWLSEHPGGRTWGYLGNHAKTDVEIRSMLLLAFGHGAEGAIFWQWRPERFGEEAPNFGLTTPAGEFTSRTEIVKKICVMIKKKLLFSLIS